MAINDIYTDGIARGWQVIDASGLDHPRVFETDVVIVGSGAGGGTAAEILTQAGLKVLLLEEGPLKTAASFKDMDELRAYRELYWSGRSTSDGAIQILQGRSVGGSTTVNWTASFRTAPQTLRQWAEVHGVKGAGVEEMAPWFERMEARLGIAPWAMPPNANNAVLANGCRNLGWEWHVMSRNVRGCVDSGYCGLGCPVNAKQSMLVSTIPVALEKGAGLIHHLRVQRVRIERERVIALECQALDPDCIRPSGATVVVRARHFILAGGAINTPALLLRSNAPDPHGRLGKRTTIHPAAMMFAQLPERIEPYYGAPQSIASDEFQWINPPENAAAYKLEVSPLLPAGLASAFVRRGGTLIQDAALLPHMHCMFSLLRDGFHAESPGGDVRVSDDGSAILDYDMSEYLWRGVRHSLFSMAEAQFAAGARRIAAGHLDSDWYESLAQAKSGIEQLPMKKFRVALFTAHLMGGCTMGEDPGQSVTDSLGRHHQIENLSVMDGSLFPTCIGANPQLSIYALVAKNATALAAQLGRPA